jgi:hypothetical protein
VRHLPSVQGGEAALAEALAAEEVASIALGGVELFGVLSRRLTSAGRSTLLCVSGGARAELRGARVDATTIHAVVGDSRHALQELAPGPVDVALAHGLRLRGRLARAHVGAGQGEALLVMASGELSGASLNVALAAGDVVALTESVTGAHAGAPLDFFPETSLPLTSVPKANTVPPRESALLGLYEAALAALSSSAGSAVIPVFERVHSELCRNFPHDWLLRWNLLESLQKRALQTPLAADLARELEELEVFYQHRQPIASGLAYLARTVRRA